LVGCSDLGKTHIGKKAARTQPVCTLGKREEALDLAVLSYNVKLTKEREMHRSLKHSKNCNLLYKYKQLHCD
jgi:hypothetical protein